MGISLQEIIKRRQQADFVGREERLAEFRSNLRLPVADHRRRFVFNIHGDAGVGKTFLTHRLRRVAEHDGAACAYTDENRFDVLETMAALSADFAQQDRPLAEFERRLSTYRKRRHELEADPRAPAGGFVTKSAVQIGLAAARGVPVLGVAADAVDANATAEQVDRLRAYLSKKLRNSDDVRLLLSPAEVLTGVFVTALRNLARQHTVAMFFDTFERTAPFLEGWLLDLLASRYGDLPANLVITIAGQRPLDPNRWSPYRSVIADVPLAPFTEAEARELLASRGVRDEQVIQVILTLSGRLPVWLATLADSRPDDHTAVEDPSDSAVERFLKWEPDERRRAIALAGALPRRLNQDVLVAVCGDDDDGAELFDWLRELPFVSETAGHWQYHDVARAPMIRLQRNRSPQRWREQHRLLAEHYRSEREALTMADENGWSDGAWQDHRVEESYHALCAAPATALPAALAHAVYTLRDGTTMARRWADMLTAAGRDSGTDKIREWGERLAATVLKEDSDGVAFLTALIDDGDFETRVRKEALRLRGRAHRDANRFEPALADFDRALRLDPDFANALAGRGETYRLMDRNDEAITDFDRAIELDPTNAWTIGSRGQTHASMGQYDKAITDLDRAIELNPEYNWAIASRGQTHASMGQYDKAITDFDRAIELFPEYNWAIASRGQTHASMGQYDKAITDFDRAIELDPEYRWAIAERGDTYRRMGCHGQAIADFDRAIELDPEYTFAVAHRGGTYSAMGRYDEAISDLTRAIAIDPGRSWPVYMRGTVHALRGRVDQAVADFRKATELARREIDDEPAKPWHRFNLTVYLAALGEGDEAEGRLTDTLSQNPSPPSVADFLNDLAELSQLPGVDQERVGELIRIVERHRQAR